MNIFLYIIIFIIGSLFGSFFTLAVYRIPKKQDIIHTHSYCPNCNHKLGLLDLFPIISYIALRGRCRYCKEKIRPRYIILEVLSGTLFILFAYLMGIRFETLTIFNIIDFLFIALYLTFIILLAGIDKENRKIEKGVSIYGIIISIMYMTYLCIVDKTNIYRYAIYLIIYIIILLFDTLTLKKFAKNSYLTGILLMIITMAIFTSEIITSFSIIITVLGICICILIDKLKEKKKRQKKSDKEIIKKVSIGFYLGISNVTILLLTLFNNYFIQFINK